MAIPYIAIIIIEDTVSCNGRNINSYLWLNSHTNVPQLLLQLLCLLPINMGFMYFLSSGNRTPVITYKPVAQLSYTYSGTNCVRKSGTACTLLYLLHYYFLSVHTNFSNIHKYYIQFLYSLCYFCTHSHVHLFQ